jgi:hypothetical protein
MRVAVVGSREFMDRKFLYDLLDSHKITFIVSGGAVGTDTLAVDWAKERGIPYHEYKPDWKLYPKHIHGVRALFERNTQIANDCEMMIAIWPKPDKGGTRDSKLKAERRGIPVHVVLKEDGHRRDS